MEDQVKWQMGLETFRICSNLWLCLLWIPLPFPLQKKKSLFRQLCRCMDADILLCALAQLTNSDLRTPVQTSQHSGQQKRCSAKFFHRILS